MANPNTPKDNINKYLSNGKYNPYKSEQVRIDMKINKPVVVKDFRSELVKVFSK